MISLKSIQIKFYLLKTHHIQVQQVVKAVDELGQQGSKSTYCDPPTVVGRTHCGKPAAAAFGGRMGRPGHCCAALKGSYPMLKLDADTVVASSHVRLLGADISLDLSVDHHVSRVCACYRLRQLRRIRRSLDSDLLATSLTLEWITETPSWPVHQGQ